MRIETLQLLTVGGERPRQRLDDERIRRIMTHLLPRINKQFLLGHHVRTLQESVVCHFLSQKNHLRATRDDEHKLWNVHTQGRAWGEMVEEAKEAMEVEVEEQRFRSWLSLWPSEGKDRLGGVTWHDAPLWVWDVLRTRADIGVLTELVSTPEVASGLQ